MKNSSRPILQYKHHIQSVFDETRIAFIYWVGNILRIFADIVAYFLYGRNCTYSWLTLFHIEGNRDFIFVYCSKPQKTVGNIFSHFKTLFKVGEEFWKIISKTCGDENTRAVIETTRKNTKPRYTPEKQFFPYFPPTLK